MWSQEVARRGATRLTVLSTNESMSTTDPTPQNGTGDILPGVNAGASVPQVGYLLVYDTTCSLV